MSVEPLAYPCRRSSCHRSRGSRAHGRARATCENPARTTGRILLVADYDPSYRSHLYARVHFHSPERRRSEASRNERNWAQGPLEGVEWAGTQREMEDMHASRERTGRFASGKVGCKVVGRAWVAVAQMTQRMPADHRPRMKTVEAAISHEFAGMCEPSLRQVV